MDIPSAGLLPVMQKRALGIFDCRGMGCGLVLIIMGKSKLEFGHPPYLGNQLCAAACLVV